MTRDVARDVWEDESPAGVRDESVSSSPAEGRTHSAKEIAGLLDAAKLLSDAASDVDDVVVLDLERELRPLLDRADTARAALDDREQPRSHG